MGRIQQEYKTGVASSKFQKFISPKKKNYGTWLNVIERLAVPHLPSQRNENLVCFVLEGTLVGPFRVTTNFTPIPGPAFSQGLSHYYLG